MANRPVTYDILANLLRGVAIGLANVVPGVSGGTLALMLGIYERLLAAVHSIRRETLTAPLRGWQATLAEFRRIDGLFLAAIAAGALGAIVAAADVLRWLLHRHHDPTFGFFFGLVLGSVIVPWRLIRRFGWEALLAVVVGVALVVGLTLAMSGEQRLASAQRRAALRGASPTVGASPTATVSSPSGAGLERATRVSHAVPHDPVTLLRFFLAGIVAIMAMILPGISGSFVLLLIGVYFDVLACISGRQFLPLAVMALGCLVGLFSLTRLIYILLRRHHDVTMAFLLGLVIGSLYAIWPFKAYQMVDAQRVDLHNIVPQALGPNEIWTGIALLLGGALVAGFLFVEARLQRPAPSRSL